MQRQASRQARRLPHMGCALREDYNLRPYFDVLVLKIISALTARASFRVCVRPSPVVSVRAAFSTMCLAFARMSSHDDATYFLSPSDVAMYSSLASSNAVSVSLSRSMMALAVFSRLPSFFSVCLPPFLSHLLPQTQLEGGHAWLQIMKSWLGAQFKCGFYRHMDTARLVLPPAAVFTAPR